MARIVPASEVPEQGLPGALLEDTFWPDEIVAVSGDDGSVHLLMYVGQQDEGFLALKHAVVSPQHAAGLFRRPDAAPDPALAGPQPPERVPAEWRRPERASALPGGQPVDDDLLT